MPLKKSAQAGFTLLEILLVIVMIAITSAMIVPSIQMSGATLEEEANRLRLVMRFAMEQSQFSGMPIRWVGTQYGWHFEYLEQGDESYTWSPYEDSPIGTYDLADGIIIQDVNHSGELVLGVKTIAAEKKNDEQSEVGIVLLLPDGTTSLSDIRLADEHDESNVATLEVRPGPAGIRIKKQIE